MRWQEHSVANCFEPDRASVLLVDGAFGCCRSPIWPNRGIKSGHRLAWVEGYFTTLLAHGDYWLGVHREWLGQRAGGRTDSRPGLIAIPGMAVFVLGAGLALNPHSVISGNPRVGALGRTIGTSPQWGCLGGMIIVLGQWRRRWLKLPETLSVLCIAPPGTGKTAAVVVPTILDLRRSVDDHQ